MVLFLYNVIPNHSGLLAYTAAAIGELHGIDADEVGRITAENAALPL